MTDTRTRLFQVIIVLLGAFSLSVILAFHNITDGDLWAKLAIGETVWKTGHIFRHDVYAFTPTLPEYIDHECGAGVVFYDLLHWFGPASLIVLRMVLALGLLAAAAWAGRRQGCSVNVLLLLAIPAAASILTGYIPVVRSHVFTFFLFAVTLLCVEELRGGARWPAVVLPLLTLAGTNLHGGFVVALGVVFFYCAVGWFAGKNRALMAFTAAACAAVTLINPYGLNFWRYLIPALLHPRARIAEFRPPPLLASDDFWGFRLMFAVAVIAVAAGWRHVSRPNYPGLAVMAGTAFMGWHSRRHGPFLGAAALAFAGPYAEASLKTHAARLRFNPVYGVGILYVGIAFFVALKILPGASLQPLAPVGQDPVREADILALAGARGNLATPFAWGSYLSWRLYPKIKISMDGRYETAYPESTFALNNDFFDHGADWFRLCRQFKVDYVILDLQTERLRPEDLIARGYVLIWKQDDLSALLALPEHAQLLLQTATNLPPTTIDPLDLRVRDNPSAP
ncbi:MAG TPA: hypothetical protein VMR33_02520 [Candidatus Baltobacteraceae bacterium]|nr:hypothetical protein [Candidatus Baltobacteraceae bacterium]